MNSLEVPDHFGLVGATLASRYYVEAAVCETGMSVVYRAIHRVWKRPVAIKAFKVAAVDERARNQLLEGFVREGALLAELSERTAAVCQARDVASVTTPSGEWIPYLVLEWLEGEPLDEVLLRERAEGQPARSLDEAFVLLSPVANALSVAHRRGIVHRDIKPGNIFVLADGAHGSGPTKLLDFGIAVTAERAAASGARVVDSFTPVYGSPEQFSEECTRIGTWTDVFALALVFVELLAGHEALAGDNIAQLAVSACNPIRRPTPRALGVSVPEAVEQVLARALEVEPADRFPDASSFWSALSEAIGASRRVSLVNTLPVPLVRRRAPAPATPSARVA